jgi:hypothetical protein
MYTAYPSLVPRTSHNPTQPKPNQTTSLPPAPELSADIFTRILRIYLPPPAKNLESRFFILFFKKTFCSQGTRALKEAKFGAYVFNQVFHPVLCT